MGLDGIINCMIMIVESQDSNAMGFDHSNENKEEQDLFRTKSIYIRKQRSHMSKLRKSVDTAVMMVLVFAMTTGSVEKIYAGDKKSEKEAEVKATYEVKELPVFKGELTDETITVRFYDATPNVPYIGIGEYYNCVMKDSLDDDDEKMTVEKKNDNTYILRSAHGEAVVDPEKGLMSSDDMDSFTNLMCLIQKGMGNCYVDGVPYVRVKEAQTTGDGHVEYDLAKYNIKIYGDDKDVYFPESTLSDIFTDLVYHYSVCNGETFYFNCVNPSNQDNISMIDPDYAKPIMEKLDKDLNRPDDMAEYAYNELMFSFDHFYGLPGTAVLNDDIREKGLEQALIDYGEEGQKTVELLKSKNLAEYMCGLDKLQLFVDDGGHTGVDDTKLANAEPDELKKAMDKINKDLDPLYRNIKVEDDKIEEKWTFHAARIKMRDDVYKKEKYIKEGDTAVYVLDSFMGFDIDKWNRYYKEDGAKPTILTMRDDDILNIDACLKDADSDPRIKNFVFDCSNNPGGSLDEVAMLYSMITGNRESTFYMENALTGQKITETYEADLNFDRKFDEEDNRDPYNLKFAVITSPSSFSCGNLFPSVMKEGGYTLLGERSGGGGCAIIIQTTGEGLTYRISAYMGRLLNKDGESIDNGIPVDIDLVPKRSNGKTKYITVKDVVIDKEGNKGDCRIPDYSDFYNIERLSEELNKLNKPN